MSNYRPSKAEVVAGWMYFWMLVVFIVGFLAACIVDKLLD